MHDEITTILPKWIRPKHFEKISGISVDSQKHKMKSGYWMEGKQWKKGPDGNLYINWRANDEWVELGYKQTA